MSENSPNVKPFPLVFPKFKCTACLCLDRTLKPIQEPIRSITALVCPELYLSATISRHQLLICWECEAMILKIKKFKDKISEAQILLKKAIREGVTFKGLSDLKTTAVEIINVTPPPMPIKPQPPIPIEENTITVEIKQEKTDESDVVSKDYDELIPPTTITQASALNDYSTDTASEADSINDNEDPLLTVQSKSIPRVVLKKPLILLKNFQTKHHKSVPVNTPKIRIGANAKFKYVPQNDFYTRLRGQTKLLGGKRTVKLTRTVRDIVRDKNGLPNTVKDKNGEPNIVKAKNEEPNTVKHKNYLNIAHVEKYSMVENDLTVPNWINITEIEAQLAMERSGEGFPEIKCKLMNREELKKYMEQRRHEPLFKSCRYKCVKCVERFLKKELFTSHNMKHDLRYGAFYCDICEQRFPQKELWHSHYKAHFILYECLSCRFRSQSKLYITNHVYQRHQLTKFECKKCPETFKTYRDYKNHCRKAHHNKPTCEECGKSFNSVFYYKMHEATHKNDTRECPKCKKAILRPAYYKHLYSHKKTKPKPEPCYCAKCETTYKSKQLYEFHLKTSLKHNTVEQIGIKCEHCGKICARRSTLKDHIESEHTYMKYICDVCKKEVESKQRLIRHIAYVHENKKLDNKLKICEICGKSYTNSASLVSHLNKHYGKRPYKCQDCGDTFIYKASLFTHRRLVHKVKRKRDMVES